ncbi:MAG: hypothetical protein RLZZ153_2409 [Pseudomonadota bacterium]|jgi:hypothetical protein
MLLRRAQCISAIAARTSGRAPQINRLDLQVFQATVHLSP